MRRKVKGGQRCEERSKAQGDPQSCSGEEIKLEMTSICMYFFTVFVCQFHAIKYSSLLSIVSARVITCYLYMKLHDY